MIEILQITTENLTTPFLVPLNFLWRSVKLYPEFQKNLSPNYFFTDLQKYRNWCERAQWLINAFHRPFEIRVPEFVGAVEFGKVIDIEMPKCDGLDCVF